MASRGTAIDSVGEDQPLVRSRYRTVSITGHVVYADTLAPVEGARIFAGNAANTDSIDGSVTTDANGDYTVPEILLAHNNEPTRVLVEAFQPSAHSSTSTAKKLRPSPTGAPTHPAR
jgi:hypothetical protein